MKDWLKAVGIVLTLAAVFVAFVLSVNSLSASFRAIPEVWEDEERGVVCYIVPNSVSCLPMEIVEE